MPFINGFMFANRQTTNFLYCNNMKKIILFMTVCLLATTAMADCAEKNKKTEVTQQNKKGKTVKKAHANGVELILFHGKQRCVTCRAIETEVLAELNANFAKLMKEGKVTFRLVDFSTSEGEKEADAYKVASSSLYINQWKNGKKTSENLTRFAFANARNDTTKYRKELRNKINALLK